MTILIFEAIIISMSSFFITSLLFSRRISIDFIIYWFMCFFAQVIIVNLFLGLASILYLGSVLALHLVIFLVAFLLFRKGGYDELSKFNFDFVFGNKLILFALSVFLGFFLVKFWFNLINPPVCADSLQYHLTFPATWLRNGNLNSPIVIFGSLPKSIELAPLPYYPINAESFFFWLMLPLRNAFLADVGEVPFYFFGIAIIYSILRKFSIKKETAVLIGLLWVLIPNLFKQIKTASQVDVICAALFLLVFNSLLILREELNFRNAILFGISLGLLVGTKALNIFWSVSLIPLFILFIYRNLKKANFKNTLICLVIIALMLLLFGGFSYIRVFLLTGNPFYPIIINFFGRSIFPGLIDKLSYSQLVVPWNEFNLRNLFFGEGLGAQFLLFIFPASIIPLLFFKTLKEKIKDKIFYILVFFIPSFMLWMYLFYIKAYWIRYIFPYLAMGLISAIVFLDKFKWGKKYITVIGFLTILSSAAELAHGKELIISLFLSFLIFYLFFLFRKKIIFYLGSIFTIRFALIFIVITTTSLYYLNDKYNREEFSRYLLLFKGKGSGEKDIGLAWIWLNEHTGNGKKIAYTGRSEIYPLFGSQLKNDIFYISLNDKPSLPHYYKDGFYRKEKNFNSWKKNLIRQNINYLFVALPHPINNESENSEEFPVEDKWARDNPAVFSLVFSNSKVRIYKFLPI